MLANCDVGDVVRIDWLDHQSYAPWHTVDGERYEVARCTTWGSVIELHSDFIVIASTVVEGDAKDRTVGDVHCLVLSAITAIWKVRSYGEGEDETEVVT